MQYIKPLLGLGLVVIAFYVGFVGISLWMILLVGVVFTAAYIQDKWFLWRDLFQRRDRVFYQSLLITYLIQVVVVAILYLLGRSIRRLMGL